MRSQTDRLLTMFTMASDGFILLDRAGVIVEANPAAERLLGLSREQMTGRTSGDPRWRTIRPDGSDFPEEEHPSMTALRTGEQRRDVVMGVHRPDGSLIWISINATPIVTDGVVTHAVTSFTDITARRKAEAESTSLRKDLERSGRQLEGLREAQARFIARAPAHEVFSRLLDLLLDLTESEYGFLGEVFHDANGAPYLRSHAVTNIAWDDATRALLEQLGPGGLEFRNLDTLFGHTLRTGEVVIANDPSAHPAARGVPPGHPPLRSYLGVPIHVNGMLVGMAGIANRAGGYAEADVEDMQTFLTTAGQLIHALRLDRDRQRAERELIVSRERHALVLAASGVGHWDWNPITDEAHFDDQWCRMIGYRREDVAPNGAAWVALLHPDDIPHIQAALEAHLGGENPDYRVEFRMRHRDGTWVWILALGRSVERDATDRVTRMVGIHLDITRHKESEQEIAAARDEATRANRAKSEFLATMSHEIRTPMNGVIGVAHLLLATALNPEQREYADTIRRSGDILLALIDDVLDFSKIEADRLELEHVPFDPRTTVAEASDFVLPRVEEMGLDLVVDWQCRPLRRMSGDPKRLRQVLVNLCSNAVKFTPAGLITLAIDRPSASELRFRVIDQGIGIPAEKLGLVFEKFAQADSSTTRKYGGTGLGLAISRRLVEAMGGAIGVESVPGEGSTFWFTVPITGPVEEADERPLAGTRIGLLSARPAVRDAVGRLVTWWGADVVPCPTIEAWRAERAGPDAPEVLLVDDVPGVIDPLAVSACTRDDAPGADVHACLVMTTGLRRLELASKLVRHRARIVSRPIVRHTLVCDAIVAARDEAREASASPASALEPVRPRRATGEMTIVAPKRFAGLRVLLAEDNDVNRFVAAAMLELVGCSVDIAEDGAQALDAVRRTRYDCIFMDCDMPVLDGYEATAAIRALEAHDPAHRTSIVALTANALVGDREKCLAAGMDDYIAKPLIPREVERVLEAWTGRARTIA